MGDSSSGWFAIAQSDALPQGGVEPLVYLGRDLVLYRGESGTVHVHAAHCRHLGAHLGYGGVVEGDAIRCPFHGWRWGADGSCSDVPYAKRIPKGAQIHSWPVCERNGFIYIWSDEKLEDASTQPGLELPSVDPSSWERVVEGRWKPRTPRIDLAQLSPRIGEAGSVEAAENGPGVRVVDVDQPQALRVVAHATPIDSKRVDLRVALFARREAQAEAAHAACEALFERIERDVVIFENQGPRRCPQR